MFPQTFRCSNAVAFGVEETPDLGQVAIALDDVVEGSRLHQKGKIAFHYALRAFLVSRNEDGRLLALHVTPHFLVCLDPRILFNFQPNETKDLYYPVDSTTTKIKQFPDSPHIQGPCHHIRRASRENVSKKGNFSVLLSRSPLQCTKKNKKKWLDKDATLHWN